MEFLRLILLPLLCCQLLRAADDYTLGPDSFPQDGVPKGQLIGPRPWASQIFEGTTRGGSNDLNNIHGNWFLANEQMLSALEWANRNADQHNDPGPRYQVNHAWGDGGHTGKHGGSIFPDIMRWLWEAPARF